MGRFRRMRRDCEVSSTPVLRDVDVPFGAWTLLNAGSVLLINSGMVKSGPGRARYFRMTSLTAVGGGANGDIGGALASNTSAATARTPKCNTGSAVNLTQALTAASYTAQVVGVGRDGSESAAGTYRLTIVPNAFTQGDDFSGGDNIDSWANNIGDEAALGGKTMLIHRGADFRKARLTTYKFRPPSGRLAVEYADPNYPSKCMGIDVIDSAHVDFGAGSRIWVGGPPSHRVSFRNAALDDTTDCTARVVMKGGQLADLYRPDPKTNYGVNFSVVAVDCKVYDSIFSYVGRGVVFGGTRNTVEDSSLRDVFGDITSWGNSTDCGVRNVVGMNPRRYPGDIDHIDGIQGGDSNTIVRPIVDRLILIQGDGDAGSIGFHNGGTFQDWTSCNLIWAGRAQTGMNLGVMDDSNPRRITLFLYASGTVNATTEHESIPGETPDNVYNGVMNSRAADASTGTNVLSDVLTSGNLTVTGLNWSKSDCYEAGVSYPEIQQVPYDGVHFNVKPALNGANHDWNGVFARADAFLYLTNLEHWRYTPWELSAIYRAALAPGASVSGRGALNSNGSWKGVS